MKKFLNLIVVMLLLLTPTLLFAQDTTGDETGVDIANAFTTFAALVGIIPVVVEFFKTLLGKTTTTPNWLVQVLSWATGIILTMFGWFFHLGFLADITWQWALIYGFGASLTANGVADIKIIQWIFSLFASKK